MPKENHTPTPHLHHTPPGETINTVPHRNAEISVSPYKIAKCDQQQQKKLTNNIFHSNGRTAGLY